MSCSLPPHRSIWYGDVDLRCCDERKADRTESQTYCLRLYNQIHFTMTQIVRSHLNLNEELTTFIQYGEHRHVNDNFLRVLPNLKFSMLSSSIQDIFGVSMCATIVLGRIDWLGYISR